MLLPSILHFEICIYIPVLPHQDYTHLFHPCSPLTFHFSPSRRHFFLWPFCPPVLFIRPFFNSFFLSSTPAFVLLDFLSYVQLFFLLFIIVCLLFCHLHFKNIYTCSSCQPLCMTDPSCAFQIPTYAGDVQRTVRDAPPPVSAQNVNRG